MRQVWRAFTFVQPSTRPTPDRYLRIHVPDRIYSRESSSRRRVCVSLSLALTRALTA